MTAISVDFKSDPEVAKVAEAYALDAVDIAQSNFGITLDWSEASIEQVEQILSELHESMANEQPPEKAIWTMARAFGSYVGEVFRLMKGPADDVWDYYRALLR